MSERHHLTGIKEIMAYLHTSRRGVQRRIKKGMPVYWEGGARWAITTELDEWRDKTPSKTEQPI